MFSPRSLCLCVVLSAILEIVRVLTAMTGMKCHFDSQLILQMAWTCSFCFRSAAGR